MPGLAGGQHPRPSRQLNYHRADRRGPTQRRGVGSRADPNPCVGLETRRGIYDEGGGVSTVGVRGAGLGELLSNVS